jgi:hypothetical protein
MNPRSRRIIRLETISPGNVDAIWDDGNGNRWREAVERDYVIVW